MHSVDIEFCLERFFLSVNFYRYVASEAVRITRNRILLFIFGEDSAFGDVYPELCRYFLVFEKFCLEILVSASIQRDVDSKHFRCQIIDTELHELGLSSSGFERDPLINNDFSGWRNLEHNVVDESSGFRAENKLDFCLPKFSFSRGFGCCNVAKLVPAVGCGFAYSAILFRLDGNPFSKVRPVYLFSIYIYFFDPCSYYPWRISRN